MKMIPFDCLLLPMAIDECELNGVLAFDSKGFNIKMAE